MTGVEIRPFTDEHLEGAARLLATRHERHRAAEPLLPAEVDFAAEIDKERDELGGAVALEGGEVIGYLLGRRRDDALGYCVWSHVAGHAVRDPELTRDLYAAAAAGWFEAGVTRHFVFVPALADLIDPWFRLSFGASAVLAMRETEPEPVDVMELAIRESTPDDVVAAARLDRMMEESMLPSPSFSGIELEDEAAYVDGWAADTWDGSGTFLHFVAERGGEIVAHILLHRRPADLRVPADSIDLGAASTRPDHRGSGVGVALTHYVLGWAHEHGYPAMTIDWRVTNLLASRFWPRRGFRESFLRLYRSIP